MLKILSDYDKKQRNNNPNYFRNGKPKISSMLCRNKEYIKEVTNINGRYDIQWACGAIDVLYMLRVVTIEEMIGIKNLILSE